MSLRLVHCYITSEACQVLSVEGVTHLIYSVSICKG